MQHTLPQLTTTTSRRIAALGYDEDSFTCYVQFRSKNKTAAGPVYAYGNVSPEEFHDFETAPSLGVYFREHLFRNSEHPYIRISNGAVREAAVADAASQHPAPEQEQTESFTTPENAIETALALAQQARSIEITTPEAYRLAGEELVRIAGERKLRLDFFKPMKEAAFIAHRTICAKENEALAPLLLAEDVLHRGLVQYRQREALQRRTQEASLDAENLRIAQEQAARHAAELAEQYALALEMEGEPELAAQARRDMQPVAPAYMPPAVVQNEVPPVSGLSFSKDWSFRIEDPAAVPLSHDWYSIDEKKIRAYVRRLKGHASIPGVRIYPVERSRKRAA